MASDKFALSEYELYTKEPESLMVGQLNSAVRGLREVIYQQQLREAQLVDALRDIEFGEDGTPRGWPDQRRVRTLIE